MTLIVAVGNPRHTALVSDRRLTSDGHVVTGESNKAFLLLTDGIRAAVSFTGFAASAGFATNRWLPDTLHSCIQDGDLDVKTFCTLATARFDTLRLPTAANECISIVLAGYVFAREGPVMLYALIGNCDVTGPPPVMNPREFRVERHWIQQSSGLYADSYALVGGYLPAVPEAQRARLEAMAVEDKPLEGLVGKAIHIIQGAAKSPASRGAIGPECTSLILPSDSRAACRWNCHSHQAVSQVYSPGVIRPRGVIYESTIQRDDGMIIVPAFPRPHKRKPCPCASGKRFRFCHGRLKRGSLTTM